MPSRHRHHRSLRTAAASAVALTAVALGGCGSQEDDLVDAAPDDVQEAAVDAGDGAAGSPGVYDGVFDGTFYEQIEDWDGQQVVLSAEVDEIASPRAFVLAPAPGTEVDPLLVVTATEVEGLEVGSSVEVTGTLGAAFDLPGVEEDTGVDLEGDRYDDFDAEPYLVATSVELVD
ncbi:hypothetical protein MO973_45830 [Paenibacillus sp. TRM 82003]|uniref:hypothetical protein n=1 Tax=Kineococcus sp. TRM81007 TaxID=2925831 RepID=UPI001F573CA6|nr:hypothetical protein [Kineococcus sp. TRM81007]MCI2240306.1 hypothetical protein [Kineococcus sp. TRM81007]MCI3927517.1 hypothetical protein [Paenibacillus sp. TRM 82003]